MAGIKRSQDNLLAAEAAEAAPLSSTSFSPKSPVTSESLDTGDEPAQKKRKMSPQAMREDADGDSQESATLATAAASPKVFNLKQKQAATHTQVLKHNKAKKHAPVVKGGAASSSADQEMSDAPSSDGEDEAEALPKPTATQPVVTGRGAILPFTPLPSIFARDVANNKYVPTESDAQTQYLEEVDQLRLHPSRHPMQTPGSAVSTQVRHAMYERYFLGKTNEECIATWNSYGGQVSSAAAISKVLLRETSIWFAEETTVLPWMARKNVEKDKLKKLGMGPKNFPAPHATTTTAAPANGARVRNVTKPKNQPDRNASKHDGSGSLKQSASQAENNVRANASFVDAKDTDRSQGDSDERPSDSGSDHSDSNSHDSDDDNPVALEELFDIKFADNDGTEPLMRNLIIAATNAFTLHSDSVVGLLVDKRRYKVRRDYLFKYCGFVRDSVQEGKPCPDLILTGHDPTIVRAFIQAITPGRLDPKSWLPEYDFEFDFADNQDLHGWDHSDPVGVIDGDRRKARKIIWDVGACMLMYSLAMDMDCNLVRNLVVDQLRLLYEEEQKLAGNNNMRILNRPRIPLEILSDLSLKEEGNFISILGTMHINRMWLRLSEGSQFDWPNELSDEVIDAIEDWAEDHEDTVSTTEQERYCRRYHLHAEGEVCHMVANDKDLPSTEKLIADLFSSLRNEAEKQCTEALLELEEDPEEILASNVIHFRGEMMQWTFRREEKVANVLLRLEKARQGSSDENPDRVDREFRKREVIKHSHFVQNLRTGHWDRWNLFEQAWIYGKKAKEASRKLTEDDDAKIGGTDRSNEHSDEPLPWDGD